MGATYNSRGGGVAEEGEKVGQTREETFYPEKLGKPSQLDQFFKMDLQKKVLDGFKRARLIWKQRGLLSDSDEDSEQEGEGVLTRRQAKLNPDPLSENSNESINFSQLPSLAETSTPGPSSFLKVQQQMQSSVPKQSTTTSEPQRIPVVETESMDTEEAPQSIDENDSDNDDVFKKETLVAENDLVKVYVIKTFLKRQKKFNLQDHQYILQFKKKTDKPILLSHVLDILEKSFLAVLENLKSFYKNETQNMIYMTLTQENLFNEFRTSPYILQDNHAKDMVTHLMSHLNRFVNSNSSMELLDKSFCVYFRVVSNIHLQNSSVQRKPVSVSKTVGSNTSNVFLPGGRISLESMLKKDCLTRSICFAVLKLRDNNLYTKVKEICYARRAKHLKQEGYTILENFQKEICDACNISLIGPHDISIVNLIANHLKIQVHIILSMETSRPVIQSFPSGNNYELPRIYLQIINDHIYIIDSLKAFSRFHQKIVCFCCRKLLNNTWRRSHRCTQTQTCFNCDGIIQTEKTILVPNEDIYFCNSQLPNIKDSLPFNCDHCNLTFVSPDCFQRHKQICDSNSKGWKCPKCGIFEFTHTFESKEKLESNHICGVKKYRCQFCFQIKEDNHICQIKKQEGHSVWPNMAFLHLAFKDFGCANCDNCYKIQKSYCDQNNITFPELFVKDIYSDLICDLHKNNSISDEPNFISLFKEEDRFQFKEYCFLDEQLILGTPIESENVTYVYSDSFKPISKDPFKCKKSSQKVSNDFANTFDFKINQKTCKSAVDKLMIFFCNSNQMSNYTVVVSDSRTLLLILKLFVNVNIIPNIFQDGQKVNFLEVPSLKIRFVHMSSYIKGSIFDLAAQFNIPFQRTYFPNSWNKNDFYNYVGNIPSLQDFYQFSDTLEDKHYKKLFWNQLISPYSFNEHLINTTRYESYIFFLCCMSFLRQAFEFQSLIKNYVVDKPSKTEFIHPFGWKICSISGFTFAVFSYFFMNDDIMYSVMQPFVGNSVLSSRGEFEWTTWLNWKNLGLNILNAFNNSEGQKCFGKHFVDGYSPVSKTVYQYRGCEFHFHLPPECSHYQNKNRTIESSNGFGTPLKILKQRDEKQKEILLKYYSFDVKQIEIIYECDWFKFKKENALEMEAFRLSTNFPSSRPLMRLTPRATLRGGFIEVYRLKFSLTENPNWKLHFADANSLYSHIALTNVFPVGKYKVILNPDSLKNYIKFVDNRFFYNNEPMQGDAAHVKIKAPSNLFRPYLPYRLNDEFNHMALCRKCLTRKLAKKCVHRVTENRCFVSCYQVTDLEKAVSLGYEILEWYELHHYSERKPIFETFVQILASQKLKSTNLFSNTPPQEAQKICDDINATMKLKGDLAINASQIVPNSAQKQLYKEMLNSFYGRFALHTNFTKHYFCRNIYEIEKYASVPDNHVLDIIPITDDVCEIEIASPSKIKPSLCGTLYLTAEINALARKFIYEEAEKIEKLGGIILSIDTDSLLFALPSNVPDPLIYSHSFGHFKTVLGNTSVIESFYSFGPRNYSITYKDSNGTYQHLLKVKGLSTQSSHNCDIITPDLYKEFIDSTFEAEVKNIYLPQLRKVVDKQSKRFHEILTYFNFGNDIHAKRFIVNKDSKYITYPFGYKFT